MKNSLDTSLFPVQLVGAGPGDPELLTLKAVKALQKATVVLVDDLVNPEILAMHCQSNTRIAWVGKRGGCQSTPQAFIGKLMVREALAGERVVRLKGGDPMIFGRATEEIDVIRAAGLELEIISGITSALAASASTQASLTNRDCAHGVAFLTAHPRADGGQELDWPTLLRSGLSLVIYMGTQRAESIRTIAKDNGIELTTPVCVVQHASASNEKRLLSTLESFDKDMKAAGIASPAVLMIGPAFSSCLVGRGSDQTLPSPALLMTRQKIAL